MHHHGKDKEGKIMASTVRLTAAQTAVLGGEVEFSASGYMAVTTGRENTLAALRRAGFLNGGLLTVAGNAVRVWIESLRAEGRTVTTLTVDVPSDVERVTFVAKSVTQAPETTEADNTSRASQDALKAHTDRYWADGGDFLRPEVDRGAYKRAAEVADSTCADRGIDRYSAVWCGIFDDTYAQSTAAPEQSPADRSADRWALLESVKDATADMSVSEIMVDAERAQVYYPNRPGTRRPLTANGQAVCVYHYPLTGRLMLSVGSRGILAEDRYTASVLDRGQVERWAAGMVKILKIQGTVR